MELEIKFRGTPAEPRGHIALGLLRFFERVTYDENVSMVATLVPTVGIQLQLRVYRMDAISGKMGYGYSGTNDVPFDFTESQLARATIGLLLQYSEHEVREFFKIDGVAPYGPHGHLDLLIKAATEARSRVEP